MTPGSTRSSTVIGALGGPDAEREDLAQEVFLFRALHGTGKVLCWGRGDWGNLSDDTTGAGFNREQPGLFPDPEQVVYLNAGAVHICARRRPGDVLCWGDNANGQIGYGTLERRPRPVSVAATP